MMGLPVSIWEEEKTAKLDSFLQKKMDKPKEKYTP
jgi:hypothetical protein